MVCRLPFSALITNEETKNAIMKADMSTLTCTQEESATNNNHCVTRANKQQGLSLFCSKKEESFFFFFARKWQW